MNLVSDKDDHVPGRISRALAICVLILFAIPGVVHSASPVYPLKLSADSRHLEDQAGVPFLMNGDTPWSLIVQLTKSEAEHYLEDRRGRKTGMVSCRLCRCRTSRSRTRRISNTQIG